MAISKADIVRYSLIEHGMGSDPHFTPIESTPWPIYVSQQPNEPDNVITVYNTAGITEGRIHINGMVPEQFGIQIRVRSVDYPTGLDKISDIVKTLDEEVYREIVKFGETLVVFHAATRRGSIFPLGRDQTDGDREAFTVNYTISLDGEG